MTVAALVLYVVALLVLFVVRSRVQHRRTGSTGLHGVAGTPREAGWWGGVLFVAALVLALVGPLLVGLGAVLADAPDRVQAGGLVLALAGFVATLVGQAGMGASRRIGVDAAERTQLVASGVFTHFRNPIFPAIFPAMVLAQTGMLLTIPSWVSAAALLALVVAGQLQVRAVEEPDLHAVHGESYPRYAARAGRFVPRVGRTVGAAQAGAR